MAMEAYGIRRRVMRRALVPLLAFVLILSATPIAQAESRYSIEKIFYGIGWIVDPKAELRRHFAILNLTQFHEVPYPENGTFETFSQVRVAFSLPSDASGPAVGTGLQIVLSYYVSAACYRIDRDLCPLGANTTAISEDVMELEIHRVLEFRDADRDGRYETGEPIVREVPLAQPLAPFASISPFGVNSSSLAVPFNWNVSDPRFNLTQGALFAGDPLLDELFGFRIAIGNGAPVNLTVNSYMFLEPTDYKGIPLTPSQLKLDILLDGVEYVAEDTAPALEMSLTSTHYRMESNATSSSSSLYTSSEAAIAFFTWGSSATVDGTASAVGSTVIDANETTKTVFLSYPRGRTILHDPVLGLSPPAPSDRPPRGPEDPVILGLVLLGPLAAAVVLGSILLLRRTRKAR
jgi:hypothetical protein